ncbi:hypothetical protein A2U01_0102384, partial [Trifolium medium]|nr:hypothetical protein [Trifolium medium]
KNLDSEGKTSPEDLSESVNLFEAEDSTSPEEARISSLTRQLFKSDSLLCK